MNRSQLFVIIGGSAILWPLVQVITFILRFPGNPVDYLGSLIFVPMGAIAGGFLALWLNGAPASQHKLLILMGYLVACPIAFIGSIGGGLFLPPLLGVTIFGALPLIVGAWVGYLAGRRFSEPQD